MAPLERFALSAAAMAAVGIVKLPHNSQHSSQFTYVVNWLLRGFRVRLPSTSLVEEVDGKGKGVVHKLQLQPPSKKVLVTWKVRERAYPTDYTGDSLVGSDSEVSSNSDAGTTSSTNGTEQQAADNKSEKEGGEEEFMKLIAHFETLVDFEEGGSSKRPRPRVTRLQSGGNYHSVDGKDIVATTVVGEQGKALALHITWDDAEHVGNTNPAESTKESVAFVFGGEDLTHTFYHAHALIGPYELVDVAEGGLNNVGIVSSGDTLGWYNWQAAKWLESIDRVARKVKREESQGEYVKDSPSQDEMSSGSGRGESPA